MVEQNRENELARDDEADQLACAQTRGKKNVSGEVDRSHQAAGKPDIPRRSAHHLAGRPFRSQRPCQDRRGNKADRHVDGGRDIVVAKCFPQQRIGRNLCRQDDADKDCERCKKPAHDVLRSGSARYDRALALPPSCSAGRLRSTRTLILRLRQALLCQCGRSVSLRRLPIPIMGRASYQCCRCAAMSMAPARTKTISRSGQSEPRYSRLIC